MASVDLLHFSVPVYESANCAALCDSGAQRLGLIQSLCPDDFSIRTRLKVTDHHSLSLDFAPSLNYLTVIGGGDNSKKRGYFNEHEFLNNAINQICWLMLSDSDTFQGYGLQETDRTAFLQLYHVLIQAYCIDQMLHTPGQDVKLKAVSANAASLFQELQMSPSLLIHCNDSNHAFYLEIEKQGSSSGRTQNVNIHLFNTGKGIFLHKKEYVKDNSRKLGRKLKFETRKSFFNVELTQNSLARLISNMHPAASSARHFKMPIYGYYALLKNWQKPAVPIKKHIKPVLQTMQHHRDCQQKSLLSVIKNKLDPRVYRAFKTSLLERSLAESAAPHQQPREGRLKSLLHKSHSDLYQIACLRLEAKIARNRARLDDIS